MLLKTKTKLLAAITMTALTFAIPKAHAVQEAPTLTEKQKSVVLFDFRVSKSIAEAKSIGMDMAALDELQMDGPFEDIKVTQIKRIFGSTSLPENLTTAMDMDQGAPEKLPFEFFVRIEFTDADVTEALEEKFTSMSSTVEIGGKKYFRPKGENVPGNLVAHRVDAKSFELGTNDYCQQAQRNFATDRLKAAFGSAPNEPVRIVIDLESRADIIQEAVEMGKQRVGDPVSVAYFELIDNANTIVITSSLAGKNLLTLIVDGKDNDQASELASGLDGLLGTAKIGAGLLFGQMEAQMSKGSLDMMKQIVNSLAAKKEGNTVKIEIAKPEGFDQAMVQLKKVPATEANKAQRMNNFRQLALGALNYEEVYKKFPFLNKQNMNEDISWRIKILPYIEQNEMYGKMDLRKGPTEEPNSTFAESMPAIFGQDGKLSNVSWIKTKVDRLAAISDGSSNTIMLLENPKGRPWLEDNPLTVDEAIELVSGLEDGADLVAVRYDGSTFLVSNENPEEELRLLFEPNDGKVFTKKDKTVKNEIAKPIVQPKKMSAAEAEKERMNNFRQLALGAFNYNAVFRQFPFLDKQNHNEDISWRIKILPYIEQNEMYGKMDLRKGPTEEPNAKFAESMPAIFGQGGKLSNVSWIKTKVDKVSAIMDGTSNTIMLLENPKGRPWLEDNPLTVDEAIELVSELEDGTDLVAVRYDGSTFLVTNQIAKEKLRSLLEPNDGK